MMAHPDRVQVGKRQAEFPADVRMVLSHHVDLAPHVLGWRLHAGQYMADQFFPEIFRSHFDDSISSVGNEGQS